MSDYLLSVILGIVEGLTEFLPVSSTAHLRITEALLKIDLGSGYWKMYSIVIQLGAILCLPIYFRRRIWEFIRTFPHGREGNRNALTHPLALVVVAFVVTAVPAWALHKVIGENLENMKVIGSALLIGGVVMWLVDALFGWKGSAQREPELQAVAASGDSAVSAPPVINYSASAGERSASGFHRTEHMEQMNALQAIWIGAVQILSAVFPGTSRSMCTIAAGQVAGMSRTSALEFSFFLSMPTMAVATLYEFYHSVIRKHAGPGETLPPVHMDAQRWIVLAIGFVVSFLVAWGVVAWFMSWVRRRGFAPFAVYRIVIGIAVLAWAFHRHIA